MRILRTTMPANDEPVRRVTVHSMGSAWHNRTISEIMVAWRKVRVSDSNTATAAYVVRAAPVMKTTALSPGSPMSRNRGSMYRAAKAIAP